MAVKILTWDKMWVKAKNKSYKKRQRRALYNDRGIDTRILVKIDALNSGAPTYIKQIPTNIKWKNWYQYNNSRLLHPT